MRVASLTIALLCGLSAGCSGPRALQQNATVQVYQGDALPAPSRSDLVASSQPYLIGPFDRLVIDVYGVEELSEREVQTDASGRISFPLVGSVNAAGLTAEQLAGEIDRGLRGRFVRNPQVSVNVKETKSQLITVEGEVREPGLYPVQGKMTLLRAIATANGTTENARPDDVVVFRQVNGQKLAALYNLQSIRRGSYGDPDLYANDVVVVGESRARQIFRDVIAVLPLLSSPLIVALQQ